MAASRNEHPGSRAVLTAGLTVVAVATGAAFGRLFLGQTSRTLAVAGAAAVLLAALLQRRHLVVALLVSAAGLAVAIGVLVFPRSTLLGLPTLETLRLAGRALGAVGRHAAEEFTPATPLPSLVNASLIAMWCAATAAHALAARSGTAMLALLPQAGLLLFASTVAADGVRFGYAIVFLLGALGVLLAAGVRSIAAWGPMVPTRRFMLSRAPGRHASWLTAGALSAAVIAPGLLPGLRAPGLMEVEGSGRIRQLGASPIVDLRPALLRDPAVELFRVRAERPAYWRLLSLERFDGRLWTARSRPGQTGRVVTGTTSLPGATLAGIGVPGPGLIDAVNPSRSTPTLEHEVEITGLEADYLPAAFQPTAVGLPTLASFDAQRSSLAPLEPARRGYRYTVRSVLVVPTPDQLRQASEDIGTPALFGVDATLPATVPRRIYDMAQRLTRGEQTPYEKVLALQRYLRTFTYDQRAEPGHGVSDIVHFLEHTRRGYCEQFAGTMAVLVRALGYGARVAVGFLPGERAPDGRFAVSTGDAHAWTEVFFPGFGWLAFEPTPTRANPVATDYTEPATAIIDPTATQGEAARTQGPDRGAAQRDQAERSIQEATEQAEGEPAGGRRPLPVTAVVAVVLVGAAAGRLALRRWRRRRRITAASSSGQAVVAAYQAFQADAAEVGMERQLGETPLEYARRLNETVAFTDGHLELLTGMLTEALYAGRAPGRMAPHEAAAARRQLARDVRRHVGRRRALVGILGLRRR